MTRPAALTLVPRLRSEFGYPRAGAELVAGKLVKSSEAIWAAFWTYWQTGELPALEVEGYTIDGLVQQHSMKPIAALLTLDWLTREPERAKESLVKGHDWVR